MTGGFKDRPLKLNEGLSALEKCESAIGDRADKLAKLAASVWAAPELAAEVLESYAEPPTAPGARHTIEDHDHLADDRPMRPLFDVLRKQVLALDPTVTEEFLKLYVAYKAETNFVDVVPQAKRLRLSLNMDFHEVYDPEGMCKDVTSLGRWGNGNVEVGLGAKEQLPYVMGLVRQAFEKQMGGDELTSPLASAIA